MLEETIDDSQKNKNITQTEDGRYHTLFEQINAGVFLTTLDGEILEANLRSCELLGYTWNELGNFSFKDAFPKTFDWEQFIDEISAKGGDNFESENVKKDGTTFPVELNISLFILDKKPVMLTVVWDITDRKKAEEQLKASEEKYRGIFDNSAVAIMLTDENEKIISWNKYTENMLGMNQDDLYMKYVESLYPPDEWKKIRAENIREKGMQHHLETKMYRNNNSETFDIDISISVCKDSCGVIKGAIGVVKDISEQKQAERKLRESEEKYEGLFECTTDGMLVLDNRGEILDTNSRTAEIFGFPEEKLRGNNFLSMGVLSPKALSIVVKQFQELLSNKKSQTHETECYDNNGRVFNVEISSFFLVKKNDQIDNFVVVIRDISDRKQTEIKLAKEHGLLQTLMDSTPDSIYFKDDDNKFIMVNKSKAAHNNTIPENMIGKTDFDFLSHEEAQKAHNDDEEVLKSGKFIINKIEKLTNQTGGIRWVSVTKIPRFDPEGNIIGTMGITRDLTDLKALEEKYNIETKEENNTC